MVRTRKNVGKLRGKLAEERVRKFQEEQARKEALARAEEARHRSVP